MNDIKNFFDPKIVAVIGASDKEGTVGRVVMENLLLAKDRRKIFPINPNNKDLYGLMSYPSVSALPDKPDLAIIVTPASTVSDLVEECGKFGIKTVIIISAGFKEIGAEGKALELKIGETAHRYGMRIIGPNCLGTIKPSTMLNTTFSSRIPKPGDVTFLSQSGALGSAVLDWAVNRGIGFSTFVSLGSMLDIDFGDLIDYFGEDPETKSIIIYAESVGDDLRRTRKFMSAARGFARTKPILILKPGKFQESAKAAMSHTGSMVGDDAYYDAAFNRAGIVRVNEIEDLFNCAPILNTAVLPKGPRLAIVTNAGGPGVLATDTLMQNKGKLADLSESTMAALNKLLPSAWSHGNPIDVLGSAPPEHYVKSTGIALADPNIDGVLIISVPIGVLSQTQIAKMIAEYVKKGINKPVLVAMMGEGEVAKARQLLLDNKIPAYSFPEDAIKTYLYMYQYARNLELLYETPADIPMEVEAPKHYLKLLIKRALHAGKTLLGEEDSKKFLTTYRIGAAVPHLARNAEEAVTVAEQTGYPIVMKIASPDISHKSDVGGVKVGLETADSVKKGYTEMIAAVKKHQPDARIEGAYIQKMITNFDYELIIGSKKDPTFGPVILFGMGGTEAEFFKDIAVGLPPLNQTLARRLLEQTKMYTQLSKGFRNKPPVDLRLLEESLIKVSQMIVDFPEIKELDINPLVVTKGGVVALDARIILDDTPLSSGEHDHLIIPPYPTKYTKTWRCTDGTEVLLRPIRPEDEPLEYELIAGLSEESSRLRFFRPIKDITHQMLTRFCNIDYDREMAIVAEVTEQGKRKLVGVGRLVILRDGQNAEFAPLIADAFQGKGLGLKLIDILIGIAVEKGLKSMYGITLADNWRMLSLARKLGFTQKREALGEIRLTLEL